METKKEKEKIYQQCTSIPQGGCTASVSTPQGHWPCQMECPIGKPSSFQDLLVKSLWDHQMCKSSTHTHVECNPDTERCPARFSGLLFFIMALRLINYPAYCTNLSKAHLSWKEMSCQMSEYWTKATNQKGGIKTLITYCYSAKQGFPSGSEVKTMPEM